MDQVFHEAVPALKAVEIQLEPAPDPANNQVADPLATSQRCTQPWQQLTLIGMTLGALLCSAWLARSWQLSEQALYRERNLALTEKLKARATPSPSASPKPAEPEAVASLPSLEPLTLPLSAALRCCKRIRNLVVGWIWGWFHSHLHIHGVLESAR
jgi:hypothetical protein